MSQLFFEHYQLGFFHNKQNKVVSHKEATLTKMHEVLSRDPRYECENKASLRRWIEKHVIEGSPIEEGRVRVCNSSGAWTFIGIVPNAPGLATTPTPSTRALFERHFRLDPNSTMRLEDMHSTLVEAGGSAYTLTLNGGDPSRNLGNWITSEYNEETANGQVSIRKKGTCRFVFGFVKTALAAQPLSETRALLPNMSCESSFPLTQGMKRTVESFTGNAWQDTELLRKASGTTYKYVVKDPKPSSSLRKYYGFLSNGKRRWNSRFCMSAKEAAYYTIKFMMQCSDTGADTVGDENDIRSMLSSRSKRAGDA